ncbi:hypothetical protein FHR83_008979 [Actinoplanes campanulatus]|uniref:Methane oxygenase PmoA n=1 Tax=Actinoplanes campanulatus TaxID=113559 RepID=A0A7W5ART7_9ACTN|nr:PmoA family protein [Actinoplanes campanulatus]MBB3101251.1 hypothetical protein [Actinoplanes campanulatus]GGN51231.1 oxidoreductase [Actinoplanes campanulatus]GID42134.1 oxidoreductase [Actinoplanes campanulatus]
MPKAQAHELRCAGRVVARYVWDPRLPATVSPRPYLHPVTTLGGTTVTGFMPDDHVHHLGASIALPIVNDVNFWGGSTYVTGHGSIRLDNHGRQDHHRWLHRDDDRAEHELHWAGRDGVTLVRERRALTVRQLTHDAWMLRVDFTLASADGTTLEIDSPAARGREGAGYGGFFWRAPAGLDRVHAYGRDTNGDVHGSRDPWVALSGHHRGGAPWTLIFLADEKDPWFVRSADYAGVCSAIAWKRLTVAPGGTLTRGLSVVIADGPPSSAITDTAMAAIREEPA